MSPILEKRLLESNQYESVFKFTFILILSNGEFH